MENFMASIKEGTSAIEALPALEPLISSIFEMMGGTANNTEFKNSMNTMFNTILPLAAAIQPTEQEKKKYENSLKSVCDVVMPGGSANESLATDCIPAEISEIVTKLQQRFENTDLNGSNPVSDMMNNIKQRLENSELKPVFEESEAKPLFYPKEEQAEDEKAYGINISDTFINPKDSGTKSLIISFMLNNKKNYNLILTTSGGEKTSKVVELK